MGKKSAQNLDGDPMPKITTFLAFDDRAEEAVNRYVSAFKNSRIVSMVRSETGGPIPKGKVLNATFELDGLRFMAMDGGPYFSFALGMSLFVNCATQAEIDRLWEKLSAGGEKGRCGWLKDKFGISWQIVPSALSEMLTRGTPEQSARVMAAMLKMGKLDLRTLRRAYRAG